ncbi:hypothetical protein ACMXLM_005010, partial [Escherichia coli]
FQSLSDLTPLIANLGFYDVNLQFKTLAPMMRTLPPDKDLRLIPVCRSYDSSARTIFGHNKTWRKI